MELPAPQTIIKNKRRVGGLCDNEEVIYNLKTFLKDFINYYIKTKMNKEHDDNKQKSNNETKKRKPRRCLIFDIDDVVLNSGETIAEIINEKYELSPKVKFEDIKDWEFTYLKREIKRQKNITLYTKDFLDLFETEEFWEKVCIRKDFLDILYSSIIRENFMVRLVSSGTEKNLELKTKFLQSHLNMNDIRFLGIALNKEEPKYSKKELNEIIPMWGAIQVDDNYECLNTNAKLKILLKNSKETSYNQVTELREDLYVINDLEELKDILLFIINNDYDFFEDFKSIPLV